MIVPLLQLTSVTKSFDAVRALRGVSFDLRAGEVHALVGENGAGKSTLIKIVTGAHQADGGTIEIAGQPVRHLTPAVAHKLGIACIYQQPALFPDLTVAENIALRLEPATAVRRVRWQDRRARATQLLRRIGVEIALETEVRHLSMPEQQLVEIACALGASARVLIMDEPTASLTEQEQHRLFAVVRDLRNSGAGIIYISHRLEEIFALADRVTVLRDGESVGTRVVRSSRGGEAPAEKSEIRNPKSENEKSLLTPVAAISEAELIKLMVGRDVSLLYLPTESPPADMVLTLRNVGCKASCVRNVTLDVRAGEIVGLAGLIGSGRTELARILFGITPADTGEILLSDQRITVRSPQDAVALGIGYVPEDRRRHGVIPDMPVAANMTMAIHRRIFPRAWLRLGAERQLALDYLRALDVEASGPEAPVVHLSGGNQQKVALARWLATKPKLLILDEPTQGVDVGAKSEIHKILRQLAQEGIAVLMISSDLTEVLGLSDRIVVMRGGTIAAVIEGKAADPQSVMAAALGQTCPRNPKFETRMPNEARNPNFEPRHNVDDSDFGIPSSFGFRNSIFGFFHRHFRELTVATALGFLLLFLAIAAPGFYQPQPLLSLFTREAPALVVSCGMALVIIGRQIDISVGSQFAVCSVCAGLLAAMNLPPALVLLASIALGASLGALNGVLVAGLRLPSIVVTLATMVAWREGLRWLRQGQFVNLPEGAQWFGLSQIAGQQTLIIAAVALLVLMAVAMKHLAAGRFVYAVGSDAEAARLAGLRPQRVTFTSFLLLGTLVGLAAMLNVVQSPQVDPNSGAGLELKAIAAVVVGGVAISGGRGSLWGVFVGLLLLACVNPALTHLHVEAYWEKAIQGVVILLAVVTDGLRMRKERN
jgi:rhamnose transport system ATP-binding protein